MDDLRREIHRVLAVDPTSRGFGFAVLEGPARLIDWGIRDTRRADSQAAHREVTSLLDRYAPDSLVLEDTSDDGSRRRTRVRSLIETLRAEADRRGITVVAISRRRVQAAFRGANASTKHAIAGTIAEHFPELESRLPPRRKPWMSEDARSSTFDAVSFALAHYLEAIDMVAAAAPVIHGIAKRPQSETGPERRHY